MAFYHQLPSSQKLGIWTIRARCRLSVWPHKTRRDASSRTQTKLGFLSWGCIRMSFKATHLPLTFKIILPHTHFMCTMSGIFGGFSKLGYPFGGPNNKDHSMLGLHWGSPILGKYHLIYRDVGGFNIPCEVSSSSA